jgi:hypothetical protein
VGTEIEMVRRSRFAPVPKSHQNFDRRSRLFAASGTVFQACTKASVIGTVVALDSALEESAIYGVAQQ